MSNRQMEEAAEQRLSSYIAQQLGVSIDALDEHPFQIEENASDDGIIYSWRILWDDTPPEGVTTYGAPKALWSEIHPADESDVES